MKFLSMKISTLITILCLFVGCSNPNVSKNTQENNNSTVVENQTNQIDCNNEQNCYGNLEVKKISPNQKLSLEIYFNRTEPIRCSKDSNDLQKCLEFEQITSVAPEGIYYLIIKNTETGEIIEKFQSDIENEIYMPHISSYLRAHWYDNNSITLDIYQNLWLYDIYKKNKVSINEKVAVFPEKYDISPYIDFDKRFTPNLSYVSELHPSVIEAIPDLSKFLNDKQSPKDRQKYRETILPLENYKIQFFGGINEGERILWANYFCDDANIDWEKEIVSVDDGGNCFFNVKINLETREIFDFYINGEA